MPINKELRTGLTKRHSALKAARQFIEPDYVDLGNFVAPNRSRMSDNVRRSGKDKIKAILDKESTMASQILAAGMLAGNASPARPWFKLGFEDEQLGDFAPVKQWLNDVERLMRNVFSRSNAYRGLAEMFRSHGDFGTAACPVLDDVKDVIRLYPLATGRYWIAEDERNKVDTLYHSRQMTVKQMLKDFGEENLPDQIRSAIKRGDLFQTHEVIRAIEPRDSFNDSSPLASDMRFRSASYLSGIDDGMVLKDSGFRSFPVLAARWFSMTGDVYGTECPGMLSLPAVKGLQLEVRKKHIGISRQVDPPLIASAGLKSVTGSRLGGGISYADAQDFDKFKQLYESRIDVSWLQADIQEVKREINRLYHVDLFRMLSLSDDPRKTAREVQEQHEEKLLMLGPVLESVQHEILGPLIDIAFEAMVDKNLLPPPPEEIQEQDLKVEYIGVLAQAQKAVSLSGVERFTGYVTQVSAVKPEVLDAFNADKAVQEYADMLGVRPDLVNSEDDVAEIRNQRAEAAAQQQQLEQAQQVSDTVKNASQTIGEDFDDVLNL